MRKWLCLAMFTGVAALGSCDVVEDDGLDADELVFRSALDDAITEAAHNAFDGWLLGNTNPDPGEDGLGALALGDVCEGAELCGPKPPDQSAPVCHECTAFCVGERDQDGVFHEQGEQGSECKDLDLTVPEMLRFSHGGKQYDISVTVHIRLDYAADANIKPRAGATGADPALFVAEKLRWHVEVTFANAAREVGSTNTIPVDKPKQIFDVERCAFYTGNACVDGVKVGGDDGTGTGGESSSGTDSGWSSSSSSSSSSGPSSGSGSVSDSGAGSDSGWGSGTG